MCDLKLETKKMMGRYLDIIVKSIDLFLRTFALHRAPRAVQKTTKMNSRSKMKQFSLVYFSSTAKVKKDHSCTLIL